MLALPSTTGLSPPTDDSDLECENDVLTDKKVGYVQTSRFNGNSYPIKTIGAYSTVKNGDINCALVQCCTTCTTVQLYEHSSINEVTGGQSPVVNIICSNISSEPVATASLGQVYKAALRATGETVQSRDHSSWKRSLSICSSCALSGNLSAIFSSIECPF